MSASQHDPRAPLQEVELTGAICQGEVSVGARGDFVVITAAVPVSEGNLLPAHILFDAETAKIVGETIARSGFAVEAREDVYGQRSIIVEQIRARLLLSIEHLLKSEEYHKSTKRVIAEKCIELMFMEML